MGGLTAPGAVQQVLKGGGHIQVLIYGEGHAVVQVVEKVVRPLEDGASWVVHGNLKREKRGSEGGLLVSYRAEQQEVGRPRAGTGC